MTWRELLCMFSHMDGIVKTYLFLLQISPCEVVVHRHEDDPALQLFCVTSQGFHKIFISWRICNVVNPGKIIHSNSIDSPSIPSNSLYCLNFKPIQFGFLFFVWLRELTDFPKTQYRLITSSSFTRHSVSYAPVHQLIFDTPEISNLYSRINFWVTSNNVFTVGFSSVFLMECRFSEQSRARKTAAFIDEDMNVPQVRECLSMSSILSPGGRFNITRNLAFTFSLNETNSAERRLFPLDVSKSPSMTELWVTGLPLVAINLSSVCLLCVCFWVFLWV